MKGGGRILWSLLTMAVAMLCGCNGGPDLPEPEIPAERIITYTAAEKTTPFATGAFMSRIKENRFTPEGEGGYGELIFESPVFMVGAIAFRGCTSLWTIELPVEVASIGNNAFDGCTALRRVDYLGDKITILGTEAFSGCESLEEFVVPDGVKEIFNKTFYNCKSLTRIELGEGVADIYDKVFYGCESLVSVVFPANVMFVGNNCFEGGRSLREVTILGERVLEVSPTCFKGCHEELTIFVPATMLESYRSSWTSYTDRLQAIAE